MSEVERRENMDGTRNPGPEGVVQIRVLMQWAGESTYYQHVPVSEELLGDDDAVRLALGRAIADMLLETRDEHMAAE